jgi:hypothetical protein
VALARYTGHMPVTFPDYTDRGTGTTLAAEPGGVYDVIPASGRLVPDLPAGFTAPGETAPPAAGPEAAAGGPEAAEPAGDPAAVPDGGIPVFMPDDGEDG